MTSKRPFYRVIRQLLVSVPDSDEALQQLVMSMGLPSAALHELQPKLQTLEQLAQAEVPAHVQSLLTDVLQGTYFRMDGHYLLHLTRKGTRPGDPTADVLFGFLLNAFCTAVDRQVRARDLGEAITGPRTEPLTRLEVPKFLGFASWADDCMRCLSAPSVDVLLQRAHDVAQISLEMASSLGIELSFGPAKTCLLVSQQRSPVARLCATHPLEVPEVVPVYDRLRQEVFQLEVVAAYRHLGCILTADQSVQPEVLFRASQAYAVTKALAHRFFSSSRYPIAIRRFMLRSLAMSRYLHGSVALTLHTGLARRMWNTHYVAILRTLTRREPGTKKLMHVYRVLLRADLPCPPLAMAYARATFLQRHVRQGPAMLFVLLQQHWENDPHKSWLSQLAKDVEVVVRYVPELAFLLREDCRVRALMESFHDKPRWWIGCVKKAYRGFAADLRLWEGLERQHKGLAPRLELPHAPHASHVFVCPHCQAAFEHRRYLASHMAKKHQELSLVRHFAVHPLCVACLRWYSSVPALQTHIRHSLSCLRRTVEVLPPMDAVQIRESEQDWKQQQRSIRRGQWVAVQRKQPVLQADGPRQPTYAERFESLGEDVMLSDLGRYFRPAVSTLAWLDRYIAQATTVGPSPTAADFWDVRPSERGQRLSTSSTPPCVSPAA